MPRLPVGISGLFKKNCVSIFTKLLIDYPVSNITLGFIINNIWLE